MSLLELLFNQAPPLLLAVTALAAWIVTTLVARRAAALGLVHEPTGRCLHSTATPHGGGVGVVIAFFGALSFSYVNGAVPWDLYALLLLAGGTIAALGLWDDITPLPAGLRLAVQALVLACAIALLSRGEDDRWNLGLWWGAGWLALLWWLNLFNFMDGIDGLAGLETLFIALGGALLLYWHADQPATLAAASVLGAFCLLASATAGFLVANWAPATIFMGDVGSTFLGLTLGLLALVCCAEQLLPPAVWIILGGVFWVDGTVTLLRRIYRGESWRQPHRDHAYQRLARALACAEETRGRSKPAARTHAHRRVCLLVALINGLWLLPLAALVIIAPQWGQALIALVALLPIVAAAFWRTTE